MDIKPIRKPWKGTMTARERFNRQMHYKSVDRCFNMEFGYWDENFTEWKLFTDNNITNNQEADVFFAFDKIAGIGGRSFCHPQFEHKIISETDTHVTFINGEGLLAESPKDDHSTIPHFIKASIITPDDWKREKELHFSVDHPDRTLDIDMLKKKHPNDRDYPLGIDCGSMIGKIRDTLTFEGLCYAVYDHPEMVEDMIETSCQQVEKTLDQLLPHFDFDYASGWEDICFNHGPILPPQYFMDIIAPRYKRINKKLKAAGIDIWYTDCDGDVRPLLPIFLDSGINCLFPYEVNSCAHPSELLDQYGGQLRMMGGFDKIEMAKGKKAIDAYFKSIAPYVEKGGYIPFCDHRCPPNVKEDDYIYYLDKKEELFGM